MLTPFSWLTLFGRLLKRLGCGLTKLWVVISVRPQKIPTNTKLDPQQRNKAHGTSRVATDCARARARGGVCSAGIFASQASLFRGGGRARASYEVALGHVRKSIGLARARAASRELGARAESTDSNLVSWPISAFASLRNALERRLLARGGAYISEERVRIARAATRQREPNTPPAITFSRGPATARAYSDSLPVSYPGELRWAWWFALQTLRAVLSLGWTRFWVVPRW